MLKNQISQSSEIKNVLVTSLRIVVGGDVFVLLEYTLVVFLRIPIWIMILDYLVDARPGWEGEFMGHLEVLH